MRALQNAHQSANSVFLDHMLVGPQGDEIREKILTKRLQFDTSPALYARVENVCALLECSKREFLEMAVIEACAKAEEVFGDTYVEATGHGFGEPDNQAEEA